MTRREAINALDIVEHMESFSILYEPGEPMNQTTVGKLKEACRMAISALRAQQAAEKNEPLTLEELREMIGEPVWVQSPGIPEYGRWAIVEGVGEDSLFLRDDFTCREYGKIWLAYRRKPEEGTK